MKVRKLAAPLGVAAIAIGMTMAPPASAANLIKEFGQPESLKDVYGNAMITYTVQGLRPSSDAIPHNGRLYESMVTNDGGVPLAALFNARAEGGANYRVLANAGPEPVPPGGSSTGKLYFDVVGDEPNSVVYNDGVQDLLVWVPGPPEGGTRP